jgi:hypothetical protein
LETKGFLWIFLSLRFLSEGPRGHLIARVVAGAAGVVVAVVEVLVSYVGIERP